MSTAEPTVGKSPSSKTYDDIVYPGGAFPASYPSHLAMVAKMCGLNPTSPRKARVLELGCSIGSNILPMAAAYPESEFLGIDYSERQVELANQSIEESKLENVSIRCESILDVDASHGKFDYIICHGVYSWVPAEVREKILQIGKDNLNENGILYVSYNVYPGWHLRGLVRDMMLFHTAQFDTPQEKIGQARGLLDFLQKYAKTQSKAYTELLNEEAENLKDRLDYYLYHDHLEEVNEPVYFHEFIEKVHEAGIKYLADSALHTMMAQRFDEEAAEILRNAPLLRREQYMDFLRARYFRSSLLCHSSQSPNYEMTPERLLDLHVTLKAPLQVGKVDGDQTEWGNAYGVFSSTPPITQTFERLNSAWPSWVPVSELVENEEQLPKKQETVLDVLMMSFLRGLINLSFEPAQIATQLSEKPLAPAYLRQRATHNATLPNLNHSEIRLQPQQRYLLERLDGNHSQEELAASLLNEIESGRFKVTSQGQEKEMTIEDCRKIVHEELNNLLKMAYLTE